MSGLFLVADDLTGALDSAASFCGRLGPIPVWLDLPQGSMPAHAAVDLATRDADAAFALQAMTGAAPQLARADIAF
ncbi:MAG: hypothetical protein OEY03_15760, partial [Rhizobacter sp.]|nr:hypothetical protein [Rhizobacter sp.]